MHHKSILYLNIAPPPPSDSFIIFNPLTHTRSDTPCKSHAHRNQYNFFLSPFTPYEDDGERNLPPSVLSSMELNFIL